MSPFTNISCVLYETRGNFIGIVTRLGHRDYNGKIWNSSENGYTKYKVLSANAYIAEIIKLFERSVTF